MADFYPNKYTADRSLSGALARGQIIQDDADLIRQYTNERQARAGVSEVRAKKITSTLVSWRRFIPASYRSARMTDIDTGLKSIKTATHQVPDNGKPKTYTQNSKRDMITILRAFLLWMVSEKITKIPRSKIEEIRAPAVNTNTSRPEDLLTRDEVLALIEAAQNIRDKAFISTFYEAGCRVGEIARLQWRDVKFEDDWVEVRVQDVKVQETGEPKERHSCLVMARTYLSQWRDVTKYSKPDDLVFVNMRDGRPVTYLSVRRIIDRLARNAGITKRLHPHLLRKTRITHLIAENYQESVVKKSMWNNLNTRMFQTYVKLGKEDINDEMLAKAGVKRKKVITENPLAPRPCGRCHFVNPPTARFCNSCGSELTEIVARSKDESRRKIEESPEFKAAVDLAKEQLLDAMMKKTG